MNIQIHAHEFSASEQLVDFIRRKLTKLEQYYDHIIDAEVFLSLENKSSTVKDKASKIRLSIPGHQLIGSSASKSFEDAIDNAIDAIKTQLTRHKEKQKGQ